MDDGWESPLAILISLKLPAIRECKDVAAHVCNIEFRDMGRVHPASSYSEKGASMHDFIVCELQVSMHQMQPELFLNSMARDESRNLCQVVFGYLRLASVIPKGIIAD